jgi:hypothetical protein
MEVVVFGASDDLIEFEGDIRDEIDVNSSNTAKKFYVYCENELQFTFQVKFVGFWQIIPQLDIKTADEDNHNYCKNWDISLKFWDSNNCRYSTSLFINSHGDDLEITRKRKKI